MTHDSAQMNDAAVAIIGMACRFPLGNDIRSYWANLRKGVEAVRFLSDEELLDKGISPAVLEHKNYVNAVSAVEGIEYFDAKFFGFSRREAEILDPQQRLLLECAYHALEQAGYAVSDGARRAGSNVGVYVGAATSSYAYENLLTHPDLIDSMGVMNMSIGNEKDFVAAQLAYRLNLTGPAVNVNTACSTSLVAVHHAANSLLNYECDMALAGGATLRAQQQQGYLYTEGGILSADGHCRPFSADSDGTVDGNGAGLILLKRLSDAIEDGDYIHAVIEASAINNDGADKMGITAPSVKGQARVIHEAITLAEISAQDLGYIEAHGTGTKIGDPIEMAALNEAFSASIDATGTGVGERTQFCAIGSVKSNMGHLDAAAGIAGLIKAALAVEYAEIPPSLHATETNSEIDFANSPFYVANSLQSWNSSEQRRFAGVSSFGIGGTNAHVILGQAPETQKAVAHTSENAYLLPLSAATNDSLLSMIANLKNYIADVVEAEMSSVTLGDVAYSLSLRPSYPHRHICLVTSLEDAGDKLQAIILKDRDVDGAAFQQAACSDQLETTLAVLLSALDGDDSGGQRVTSLHRQASLWHKGAAVDFSVLYQSQIYNKVPLPGYVFVKEKLWIEPAALPAEERPSTASAVNKDEILAPSKPNLYCYEWRAQPVILNNATQNNLSASLDSESLSSQLIFWDGGGVAKARYQQSNDCINVIDAKAFSQQSESQFTLQMESAEQLKELAEILIIQKRSVSVIEYCAFLDIPNQAQDLSSSSAEELLRWQQRLLRLVDFVKEVGRRNSQLPLLRVYFNQAFSVTGTESISPVARALAAMLVVINQELAEFKVQVVDVEHATTANLLANVQAHLNSTHFNTENHTQLAEYRDEVFYVIRGRKLWTRVFRQVDSSGAGTDLFNRESTVVFIGGLGQVGQEASKHLSMLSKHLIIIGRKDVAQLDSSAQSALKRMQMINSQVEYRSVDISDGDQLRSSLSDIVQEKGTINLLIHGAGDMHREKMCSHDQSNTDDLLDQHQAKVKGSLNLLAASSEIDIEHIVATSSLSASLGGLGMMAYAAANAYMDALAENTNATCRWYSVDFDGLAGVKTLGDSSQRDDIYIRPDQLVELTTYLLNRHEPGLWLYAHGELNERWQRSIKKLNFSLQNDDSQERKEFADEEIESALIALYEKLTGHEGIQPTDNFFGVGGDSVTATQLRMLIEKDFLVDISIESIFDHPVVSELTELIKTGRGEVDDSDDELAKLLEQVEQMDELDTERLLEESS